jgi:BirA family biotin operon repressor/biotin-[acetyl-CoA-carboxylase] ligase
MPKKIKGLLLILIDGNFHSHNILIKKLGINRLQLKKIIKQLSHYGLEIEEHSNLGYRILQKIELLDKDYILRHVSGKYNLTNTNLVIFDQLLSTNLYLSRLVKNNPANIRVCLAEYQSSGRGRRGRKWVSPLAQNIYLSLLESFVSKPQNLHGLSLVVAVAVVTALKKYGIKSGLSLKWPNDILWQQRKLSGILIELFAPRNCNITQAVIGVGLNVAMAKKAGKKINQSWADIWQITKKIPRRNHLAYLLLEQLLAAITTYQHHGLLPFIKKWRQQDAYCGKKVTVITAQQKLSGIGMGINDQGYFLLQDNFGKIVPLASGEISLRLR